MSRRGVITPRRRMGTGKHERGARACRDATLVATRSGGDEEFSRIDLLRRRRFFPLENDWPYYPWDESAGVFRSALRGDGRLG